MCRFSGGFVWGPGFGCSSLTAALPGAEELSRLARGHRGAAWHGQREALRTLTGSEGQRVLPFGMIGVTQLVRCRLRVFWLGRVGFSIADTLYTSRAS